jgi:hypothetical protein
MRSSEQSMGCRQNLPRQNQLLVYFDQSSQLLSKRETLQRTQEMSPSKDALLPNVAQLEHLLA